MIAGTSLVVQWLRLRASIAGGTGSIPDWGTKIPHVMWPKTKQANKQNNMIAVLNGAINTVYFLSSKSPFLLQSGSFAHR